MNEKSRPAFAFALNWKITLASLLFFPILISLGIWQLHRATEKQTILDSWHAQQAKSPVGINKLADMKGLNAPLTVSGEFDQHRYWLLENRFFQGKLGYEVLMVFRTLAEEHVLVNRGWVAALPYREQLPEFVTPQTQVTLLGSLKPPTDFSLLQDKETKDTTWPQRVLEVDIQKMNQSYGVHLFPEILKLDAASMAALNVHNDLPVNVTPAKHRAYAFQWFSMALALLVLWLIANSNIVQVLKNSRGV